MSIIRREQLVTPLSASYAATASIATSASYAATASYAENAGVSINTGSFVTTSSFNAYTASINSFTSSINIFTASYSTGSFTGSFIGSLIGTSSWAVSASQAISASFYQETDPIFTAVSGTFVTTSSFNNFTSSYNTGSFTGSFTGSLQGTATTASFYQETDPVFVAKSASLATTGSNIFIGNQTITGSLTITNNITVLGSASIQYISESTLNIGTNLITVNTNTPSVRFGGLAVIDSGSSPLTSASFLYDSVQDEFIFVHKGDGTNITSSHFVLGPETYNSLGNETYLTANRIPKGKGNEHLNDSNISDNGSLVSINSNTNITGSLTVTGSLFVSNSIDSNRSTLLSDNSVDSLNWENRVLFDNDGNQSADWKQRYLLDSVEGVSIDWESRVLLDPNGDTILDWADISTATFYGTASYANLAQSASFSTTSSFAITSSFVQLAQSASLVNVIRGVVPASSRSYVPFVENYSPGPGTYEQLYTNSGAVYLSGSILYANNINSSFTGSLLGTASFATTASYINPTFISASAAASGFGSGGGGGVTVSTSSIVLTLDGLGGTVTTGSKGYIRVPFDFIINSWSIIAVPAGTITFDVWKANNTVPTVANTICGGNFPSASSPNTFTTSSNITSWTSGGLAGDIIGWNLASASNASFVTFQLNTTRTL
jgi:hypothetical protein